MRKLLVVAIAACGSNSNGTKPPDAALIDGKSVDAKATDAAVDAKVFLDAAIDAPPDASQFDFSCFGQPLPTTASATVTIMGTARVVALVGTTPQISPLQGASISACKVGAATCTSTNRYGVTTSDAQGAFTIGPVTTNGTPVDAFLKVTATGDRPIQVFPPYPVVMDMSGIPAVTFDNGLIALLGAVGITQSAANGMIGIFVTDCAGMPLDGATVSATQGGNAVGTVVAGSQFSSMAQGAYFVFDVPPGATTVTATFGGMTFRTNPPQIVPSIAGTTTETQVRPGP